ncbi:MAG: hypothetical protein FI674_00515 [SAR202 cluster bacterium]|nr:hypothetical protein [SAR202 cluster bacterium]|tara:strand:- start:10002 stop:10220 length:219 start_codon:yes stop_codon:yes gene_type:complete
MIIVNSCPKCKGTLIVNQTIENEEEIRCVTCGLSTPTTDNFHKLTGREIMLMLTEKSNLIKEKIEAKNFAIN